MLCSTFLQDVIQRSNFVRGQTINIALTLSQDQVFAQSIEVP